LDGITIGLMGRWRAGAVFIAVLGAAIALVGIFFLQEAITSFSGWV